MNEQYQKHVSNVEYYIQIHKNSTFKGTKYPLFYHVGMLNGMIFTHSILTGDRPRYEKVKIAKTTKIRHKSIKRLKK